MNGLLSSSSSFRALRISICPNRRGPRQFCGARLCEPQHASKRRDQILAAPTVVRNRCASQRRGPERGSVSRTTLKATDALDLSKRWVSGKTPAGHRRHRPALLWLRLRRGCAVSQVFNLPTAACEQRSADYKSAIRQIENLRYGKHIPPLGRG